MMGLTPEQYLPMLARLDKNKAREVAADACDYEGELQSKIDQFCKSNGWLAFRSRMDRKTTRRLGECDFCCLLPGGVVIFVECKRRYQKLSSEQLATHAWMRKLGHDPKVVYSLAEFIDICGKATSARPTEICESTKQFVEKDQ